MEIIPGKSSIKTEDVYLELIFQIHKLVKGKTPNKRSLMEDK